MKLTKQELIDMVLECKCELEDEMSQEECDKNMKELNIKKSVGTKIAKSIGEDMDVVKDIIKDVFAELMEARQDMNEASVGGVKYAIKSAGDQFVLYSRKTGKSLNKKYGSREAAKNALKTMMDVAKKAGSKIKPKKSLKITSTMDIKKNAKSFKEKGFEAGAKARKKAAKSSFKKSQKAKTKRVKKARKAGEKRFSDEDK